MLPPEPATAGSVFPRGLLARVAITWHRHLGNNAVRRSIRTRGAVYPSLRVLCFHNP
ncbi:MAG: hypothetical protein V1782_03770 [Pseudomonadota bacterium]